MENWTRENDESDLEHLFIEVRRYPLLSAADEQLIDRRKWSAISRLQDIVMQDPAALRWLAAWASHCGAVSPDIRRFRNRHDHYVLRRDLADYLEGGSRSEDARCFCAAVNRPGSRNRPEALARLELPPSLVVGLACWLLRKAGTVIPDRVADGLDDWETQWPGASLPTDFESGTLQAMRRAHRDYSEARDALVLHNLRLVISIAGRHRSKGIAYLDLVQEGTLGLIRAAEKYDNRKGFRFSTYSFNWINQSIQRFVGDSGAIIRYPTSVQEQVARLYRHRNLEQARTGVEPGDIQLARSAGMSLEKTRNLLQLRNLGISLDAPLYNDEDGSLLDRISGGPFADTEKSAEIESLRRCLQDNIDTLDPAEREVVMLRWGLHDRPPLTRAEIADRLKVSREWVRQLERSALKKLAASPSIRDAYEYHDSASSC